MLPSFPGGCSDRHVEDLAGAQRPEAGASDAGRIERPFQRQPRLVDALVGQAERAPVVAGDVGGGAIVACI